MHPVVKKYMGNSPLGDQLRELSEARDASHEILDLDSKIYDLESSLIGKISALKNRYGDLVNRLGIPQSMRSITGRRLAKDIL